MDDQTITHKILSAILREVDVPDRAYESDQVLDWTRFTAKD
jgi:hypothetical protein